MKTDTTPRFTGSDARGASRIWIPPAQLPERRETHLHLLLWQAQGQTECVVEGVEYELVAGHALWVPVEAQHSFSVRAGSVTVPLPFDSTTLATTLSAPTVLAVHRELHTLMLAYSVSWSTAVEADANLARQLLSLIEESPAVSDTLPLPRSAPARSIAEALRFNPGDVRSLEELAMSVHTSQRTLERIFKAETGMTMRQWRLRARMEASALLFESKATAAAVAQRVGYTSVDSFRRAFKEHFGVSPAEYVRRYRSRGGGERLAP